MNGARSLQWTAVLLALGLASLGAVPAAATGFRSYGEASVAVNGAFVTKLPYNISGFFSAGQGVTYGVPEGTIQLSADSLADVGGIRAHAFATLVEQEPNGSLGFTTVRRASASAVATYTDLVVTGPAGSVMTSVNMHLHGTIGLVSTATALGTVGSSADVAVEFRLNGTPLVPQNGLGHSGLQLLESTAGNSPRLLGEFGILTGWRSPGRVITSPPFQVTAGTPFTLEIELGVVASAGAGAGESAFVTSANSDFGSTLRFVTNAPVFNLPTGYSASSADAGITDNVIPCTGQNCTPTSTPTGSTPTPTPTVTPGGGSAASSCDAAKIQCVAKVQACLLKVHAAAEKAGVAPDQAALDGCVALLDGGPKGIAKGCLGKLEAKQNVEKPKTLCTVTEQVSGLRDAVGAFVTDVVSAIDPAYPAVGPSSTCDAGKKKCVAQRTACLLKERSRVAKVGGQPDPATMQKCADAFDGGSKGFAKGCLGKLEAKQDEAKPPSLCAATGDVATLANATDAFVAAMVAAVTSP